MKMKYADGFDDIKHLPFEEKVIEVLGDNHTHPIQFDDVTNYDEPYGLYTYRGEVCVFRGGVDLDYSELTDKEKKVINQRFDSGKWKINKALQ